MRDTRAQGEVLAFPPLASPDTRLGIVTVEKGPVCDSDFLSLPISQLVPSHCIPILEGLSMAYVLGKFMIPLCLSRTDVRLIFYRIHRSN